jgi:hypothetical protein
MSLLAISLPLAGGVGLGCGALDLAEPGATETASGTASGENWYARYTLSFDLPLEREPQATRRRMPPMLRKGARTAVTHFQSRESNDTGPYATKPLALEVIEFRGTGDGPVDSTENLGLTQVRFEPPGERDRYIVSLIQQPNLVAARIKVPLDDGLASGNLSFDRSPNMIRVVRNGRRRECELTAFCRYRRGWRNYTPKDERDRGKDDLLHCEINAYLIGDAPGRDEPITGGATVAGEGAGSSADDTVSAEAAAGDAAAEDRTRSGDGDAPTAAAAGGAVAGAPEDAAEDMADGAPGEGDDDKGAPGAVSDSCINVELEAINVSGDATDRSESTVALEFNKPCALREATTRKDTVEGDTVYVLFFPTARARTRAVLNPAPRVPAGVPIKSIDTDPLGSGVRVAITYNGEFLLRQSFDESTATVKITTTPKS